MSTHGAEDDEIEYDARAREALGYSRWWQVAAAVVMMGLVSPYQYVWSSIESPLATRLGVPLPALGLVFTLFVVFQAGSQVPVGWWRDRYGPRRLTALAGVLAGGGYLGVASATAVWQLYLFYSLGAVGVGIVYTVAVNTAIKWFPDRRGLTVGAGTMAFAGGSALAVPYVRANATVAAFPRTLVELGTLIGVGILLSALVLRDPPDDWLADVGTDGGEDEGADGETGRAETEAGRADTETEDSPDAAAGATDTGPASGQAYDSGEMLRTPQFWLLYAMFVAVSGAGLMLTAKVVSFASHLGLAADVATLSATVLPLSAGVGRLVVGDLSDRFPREHVMAASFGLCGVGLALVVWFGQQGSVVGFLGAVVVATFFWSPQYTLFPSVIGDYYGSTHSSTNYAFLYSGKMWGGVFGGVFTGWLVTTVGWTTTFLLGAVFAAVAGLAALVVEPPTR